MLDVIVNSIRLSDDNIYAQLKRVVQMAEEGNAAGNVDHVGILTAGKRNVWAAARQLLAKGTQRTVSACRLAINFDSSFLIFINMQII